MLIKINLQSLLLRFAQFPYFQEMDMLSLKLGIQYFTQGVVLQIHQLMVFQGNFMQLLFFLTPVFYVLVRRWFSRRPQSQTSIA